MGKSLDEFELKNLLKQLLIFECVGFIFKENKRKYFFKLIFRPHIFSGHFGLFTK